MFFKRNKMVPVPAMNEVEFEEEGAKYKYATRKEVALASVVPVAAAVGFGAYTNNTKEIVSSEITSQSINAMASAPESNQLVDAYTPLAVNAIPQPQGIIADASLEMLANVLDPVTQILVAISFPIASVIMIGACFFFMIGNTEKAWSMIMNAGLGYVLIQLSPLFLEILRKVGEAV